MLDAVRDWLPVQAWGEGRAAWRAEIVSDHGEEQLAPMIHGWVAAAEAIVAAGGDIALGSAHLIRCPVLLVNGVRETGNAPRDVRRLAARIPNAQPAFVPKGGHAVHKEAPPEFLRMVRAFLFGL